MLFRSLGIVAIVFFTIKGLIWLALFLGIGTFFLN
jgi:hypothetical protein